MKILITIVFCFIAVGLLSAAVINVEPGIDQISTAMTTAASGDVLELAEGAYWESNTLNTIDGDLTIRGAASAQTIIYGPTKETGDLIHVMGNLWLENLVLVGSEKSFHGIVNYHGGVAVEGEELTAEKNNLYLNNCISMVFDQSHIEQPNDLTLLADNLYHPYDTLRVTNCLFYGADVTNSRAIKIRARQGRYIEVRNCTMYSLGEDGLEVDGGFIGSASSPGAGSDLEYVTTIADHLTIYNTYNNCPEQVIGRGGDGIHFEWSNRKQSMTNTIAFRTGRFCFKGKRGEPELTVASYCMGDSANVSGDYDPPTVYYWTMKKGEGCWEANPAFNNTKNGDFSLNPSLSDAIGGADDGSNMGDPHWDDASTFWPSKADLDEMIETAKNAYGTDVAQYSPGVAKRFHLYQNHPNPFNPNTTINYSLDKADFVTLTVYSITGQQVRILINEEKDAGFHTVHWDSFNEDGELSPSGMYLYVLKSGGMVNTKKMLLLR